MRDPRDLYSFEAPEVLAAVPREGLTLVHALPGMVDAGSACRIAATYLRDELRHVRLVSFDVDELLDYRGSRPQAVFDGISYRRVEIPEVTLSLMYDESDHPFLFLDGPEPDLQWKRLTQALVDLVEYFGVERVVGMQAVPMAVPHTRPIGLFAHANDPELLGPSDRRPPVGALGEESGDEGTEIVIPAGFGSLLEVELGRSGHAAMGYAAQVPHYLTRTDFPAGAPALLRRVSGATGHAVPERGGPADRLRPRGAVRRRPRGGRRSARDDGGPPHRRRDRGALRALPRGPRRRRARRAAASLVTGAAGSCGDAARIVTAS